MAKLKDCLAFLITDKSRNCYLARRMDGKNWEWKDTEPSKVYMLSGSKGNWLIGNQEAESYPAIALCEGGPDFLAAFGHAFASGVEDRIAPVCITSSGVTITEEALACFTGKRVRIFAHNDDPGQQAAEAWMSQLAGLATVIDTFNFVGLERSDGEPIKDLNDLSLIDYDC